MSVDAMPITSAQRPSARFATALTAQPIAAVLVCAILCIMPAAFALLTWQPDYEYTAIRHYSLPVVVAEGAIIIIAMVTGFSVLSSFAKFSALTKIAGITWLASVVLAAIFASADPAAAQALCVTSVIHALFFLALIDRFNGPWRSARPMMIRSLVLGMALFTVIVCILAWTLADPAHFQWMAFGAGVSNLRQLGFYGLALVGLSAGTLIGQAKPRLLDWPVPFLFIGFFLCDWSGGRAAFGASIVILVFLSFFADRKNLLSFLAIAIPLFLIAIPLSSLAAPHSLFGAQTMFFRLSGGDAGGDPSAYSSLRLDIWAGTWQAFLDQPWIGHGDGQLRHQVEGAFDSNHPHNAPLRFLYSWGIIGTIALGTMLWRPVFTMARAVRKDAGLALPAIGTLAGLGAMSLLEGSLYHAFPVMICLIALMLLFSINSGHPSVSKAKIG